MKKINLIIKILVFGDVDMSDVFNVVGIKAKWRSCGATRTNFENKSMLVNLYQVRLHIMYHVRVLLHSCYQPINPYTHIYFLFPYQVKILVNHRHLYIVNTKMH